MKLVPVERADRGLALDVTYQLLAERPPEANISHKRMPEYAEHVDFFDHHPYRAWFLIFTDDTSHPTKTAEVCVGSIYLSRQDEIGIFILQEHQRRGYAREAIRKLMQTMQPSKPGGRFLANVAPRNKASIALFRSLGANHIQNTFELPSP